MKADVLSIDGKSTSKVDLPSQFDEQVRADIIKRAVLSIQSHKRTPYGAKEGAGMRASADVSKRRRKYRGSYGTGISRVPRKVLSRSGTRMNWVGAVAPGTIGGRRAHPPKASKIWDQKINNKERRMAIRSAISATVVKDVVEKRNHVLPKNYPLVIEEKAEGVTKTKDALSLLSKIGLQEELKRVSVKTVRAGSGKSRGRKYKKKTGPLIVVSKDCKLMSSAKNLPGVDIVEVKNLNAELLAPGCLPGRLTIWTLPSIEKMNKEKLFELK
ncbi:50S ribosomal protein L4 [Nanoarchaeota archaeon]